MVIKSNGARSAWQANGIIIAHFKNNDKLPKKEIFYLLVEVW